MNKRSEYVKEAIERCENNNFDRGVVAANLDDVRRHYLGVGATAGFVVGVIGGIGMIFSFLYKINN
jgi:hypothetical protein